MSFTPLSHQLLDEWLAAIHAAGAPVPDRLGPPATPHAIEAAEAVIGFVLPELRTLWSWASFDIMPLDLGSYMLPLPPADVARWVEFFREQGDDWAENGVRWEKGWVPWNTGEHDWLFTGPRSPGPTAPVHKVSEMDLSTPTFVAPSIGDVFKHWTERIVAGQMYADGGWEFDDGWDPYPRS